MTALYKKITNELIDEISRVENTWNSKINGYKTVREILVALKTMEMVINKRHHEIDMLKESEQLLYIDLYNSIYLALKSINDKQPIDDIIKDYLIVLKDYRSVVSLISKK